MSQKSIVLSLIFCPHEKILDGHFDQFVIKCFTSEVLLHAVVNIFLRDIYLELEDEPCCVLNIFIQLDDKLIESFLLSEYQFFAELNGEVAVWEQSCQKVADNIFKGIIEPTVV